MAASMLTPIPAASAIVLRDGPKELRDSFANPINAPEPWASHAGGRAGPLEVLMMHRHARSSFAPDVWVFPGGAVEEIDRLRAEGDLLNSMRYAAARELFEETGVSLGEPLDLEKLVWTSRWITPKGSPKRFDTYFFLTLAGRDVVAVADEREAVDITWISPAEAIERSLRDDFPLVFPTLKNLEAMVGFGSVAELIESRRGARIEAIEPLLVDGRPVLP
jgi:8-oxo-dGTP pyrophosphatase MutT (NUDIX family)